MSIQVLSTEIINQIAAGEVVEKPAHLVKELVENSLDAGSDRIEIEVSEGGRFIRVKDNGRGILSNELTMALQRHATSKITQTNDLWNLHTFGFRGEALASAAAVSKLTLISIHETEKKSSQIQSQFGLVSQVKPASLDRGTEIKIEQLFENIPARLKFLKTEASEINQIKLVVKALALAHPAVDFKLISNSQLQFFFTKKNNKIERVQEVLEKKILFEVQGSLASFKSHIVFSAPDDVSKTSRQIWIFAQNRWVQDRALGAAVTEAYRSLLMHGEYPHAVVWLECAPSVIDVNIHPTKSQVKFQDASTAFRVVQGPLRGALERAPWVKKEPNSRVPVSYETISTSSQAYENLKFYDHSFNQTQFKNKNFNIEVSDYKLLSIDSEQQVSPEPVSQSAGVYWSTLQVIGQANLTYIVCQKNDKLVFVDQHAAHERVVFESLMQAWRDNKFEVQHYLFPMAIDLTEDKVEALLKIEIEIQKMGFEIEQLGPSTLGIKSAPHLVKDSSLPVVFDKMATEIIHHGGSFVFEKKVSDLFATMACHSVVRAGQSLSLPEMQGLLTAMDQYSLSSFCPHGRPVSVEKTFNELDKQFGRIV